MSVFVVTVMIFFNTKSAEKAAKDTKKRALKRVKKNFYSSLEALDCRIIKKKITFIDLDCIFLIARQRAFFVSFAAFSALFVLKKKSHIGAKITIASAILLLPFRSDSIKFLDWSMSIND